MFPALVASLAERGGVSVSLNRRGALEVALGDEESGMLRSAMSDPTHIWLDRQSLGELEPALAHAAGAVLHENDGVVNTLQLIRAYKARLATDARVTVHAAEAVRIGATASAASVLLRSGERLNARRLVIATGAWAAEGLEGLPRRLAIEPVRGQMASLARSTLRHAVFGAGGYLAPRGDGRVLTGSTEEHVGFDAGTTPGGIAFVRERAAVLCPELKGAPMLNGWSGLRPMTPDGLPIIGAEPESPSVIYACGHSRNGVLLAPLTGVLIAALLAGEHPPELAHFRPDRFDA